MKVMRWALLLLLVLLLSLLPFGIETVQAAFQATATATWQSLFQTPTPAPTRSYDCPNDLPAGWGTVTPQAWWSMSCSRCLMQLTPTLTPEPTFTPWPIATNTPGGPTATPSPTAVPDFQLKVYQPFAPLEFSTSPQAGGGQWFWIDEYASYQEAGYIQIVGIIADVQSGAGGGGIGIGDGKEDGSPSSPERQVWGGNYSALFHSWMQAYSISGAPELGVSEGDWNAQRSIIQAMYPPGGGSGGGWMVPEQVSWVNGLRVRWLRGIFGGNFTWRVHGIIYYERQPIPEGPLPVVDYCGEVNDGVISGPETDLGVSLPTIEVGQASCYGFDGYQASFLDWDLDIPPLQLCLKPIRLGQLDLFGIVISIDNILTALGGVLVLRWVLRS